MAEFVIACTREGKGPPVNWEVLERCMARLRPPGVGPVTLRRHTRPGLSIGLASAVNGGSDLRDGAVRVGGLVGSPGTWWIPGSEPPEGTYALCRSDEQLVELVSDATASRTVWYVLDDAAFLASTSQRALVQLLGSFVLDREAVAWMMTSGTLGPSRSWDERIRSLSGDSIVTLDRRAWRLRTVTRKAEFSGGFASDAARMAKLRAAIVGACSSLSFGDEDWRLVLSGGLDSRLILSIMARTGRSPRCLTWATAGAQRDPTSDATVARLVARRFGAEHDVRTLERSSEPADDVLGRFVVVGEGRTDHVDAYVDGLAMWRQLNGIGVAGVIRGDESCGSRNRVVTPTGARLVEEAPMARDYPEEHLVNCLGLSEQRWPDALEMGASESLETYRHRLNQQFYVPAVLGALNELKARYIEVVNPLLSRSVVSATRQLADSQRRLARAYVDIALASCWPVPAARAAAVAPADEYLSTPGAVMAMARELESTRAGQVLSPSAAGRLLDALEAHVPVPASPAARLRQLAKLVLPTRAAMRLAPAYVSPPPLSPLTLAFRAYIATRMARVLNEDAAALRERRS